MTDLKAIFKKLKTNNSISGKELLYLILKSKKEKNEDIETILSHLNFDTKVLTENEYNFSNACAKILNIKSNTNLRR